jgi:hypothetical protein
MSMCYKWIPNWEELGKTFQTTVPTLQKAIPKSQILLWRPEKYQSK